MIYKRKNTNHPMIVLVNNNHIRQGGWYGYQYNDMDVASQFFSWGFHSTLPHDLYATDSPKHSKGKGPNERAGLSLWLYSMVWLWYLLQKSNKRTFMVTPWNPTKATPSFADALKGLRRELWTKRIKAMFGVSAVHDKKFEFLLEAPAPAA
jgi:hypothetical protein